MERQRIETTPIEDGTVPTIVNLAPAGQTSARPPISTGVRFAGHETAGDLVTDHNAPLDRWTVPLHGHDLLPGRGRADPRRRDRVRALPLPHVVGDRILDVDARLFTSTEALSAQPREVAEQGLAFACAACAACAVANGVAYAHACEDALGLEPTAELARARTILLELERICGAT